MSHSSCVHTELRELMSKNSLVVRRTCDSATPLTERRRVSVPDRGEIMTTETATSTTRFVASADGTPIAYDVTGTGPAVVVVEGALCQRTMGTAKALRPLLSEHHTVFAYDRRGRGESGSG